MGGAVVTRNRSGKHYESDDLAYRYSASIDRFKRFTYEDERAAFQEYECATGGRRTELREEIINANLRLVMRIARAYKGRGVPLIDLIQEGNIGLMVAVEKFEWQRGLKFSSHAMWWIKAYIRKAVKETGWKDYRRPSREFGLMGGVYAVESALQRQLLRQPTQGEIVEACMTTLIDHWAGKPTPTFVMEALRHRSESALSLNLVHADDDGENGLTLADALPNSAVVQQDILLRAKEELERTRAVLAEIEEAVRKLPRQKAFVLVHRLGLLGHEVQTFAEIAAQLGFSRQRVDQIEKVECRKLKEQYGFTRDEILALRHQIDALHEALWNT